MARSRSKMASMRFTASRASGEIGVAFFPRRALAAMSASSKNFLRACAQQKAGRIGPGSRVSAKRALKPA
jgi:hypothetical protein